MSVSDMTSGIDVDEARYNRQNRMRPPETPPGQEVGSMFGSPNGFGGAVDAFSTSAQPVNTNGVGDVLQQNLGAGVFNTGVNGVQPSLNGQLGYPNMKPVKSDSDKYMELAQSAGKSVVKYSKEVVVGVEKLTWRFWNMYCFRCLIVGVVVIFVGIILRLFGWKNGLNFAIGGSLTGFFSIFGFFITMSKAKEFSSAFKTDNNDLAAETTIPQSSGTTDFDTSLNFNATGFDSPLSDDTDSDADFEYDESDPYDTDYDDEWDGIKISTTPVTECTEEQALDSLTEISKGMYTRSYLYDMFERVLPTMNSSFSDVHTISESDDEFYEWEGSLQEASEVAGCRDTLPELVELKETLYTIIIKCTRPTGFKPDVAAKELASIYANSCQDTSGKIYSKVDTIGRHCIITIFTGQTAMITLKDMMLKCKDFLLDSNNVIPVILGINHIGKVIYYDFKKLESILVTGMPRSGKSWLVQAILAQMCAYMSPNELWLYICDPKEGISDYRSFRLPHVKKFASKDDKIVDTLRQLARVEAPRRKKIIGDAGFVNIWDYKQAFPDVDLPIIYVVIDEVVTLAERMDKETKSEFQGLLIELISQLPALGIRAFLIPHVVKNDIIAKTATDLIPCRISVLGNESHIEACTGTKPRDFPFKLTSVGDMAVNMPLINSSTMFVHAPALTDSNVKNNALFDYMRRAWKKLEPDTSDSPIAQQAGIDAENKAMLHNAEVQDDTNLDLFADEDGLGYTDVANEFMNSMLK